MLRYRVLFTYALVPVDYFHSVLRVHERLQGQVNGISPFHGWGPSSPYALALGLATLFCAAVAVVGWRRRARPAGVEFLVVVAAAALWALFYSFELMAPGLEGKVFWAKLEYLGVATLPTVWLLFALGYTGFERLSPRALALLLIEPVATIIIVTTNGLHHLVWTIVSLQMVGSLPA